MTDDTQSARAAIDEHSDAINARDLARYRLTMTYPFTYQNYNGVAFTIEDPVEWGDSGPLPWEVILRTDPDWSHTEFDSVEEIARSESSAVFKVRFRRIAQSGKASPTYDAIWIATHREGVWGVQFRHNLGSRNSFPGDSSR